MFKALTVNDLLKACKEEVSNGNGDKKILISQDDEGNYFHQLWYLFDNPEKYVDGGYLPVTKDDVDEYIILG